MTVNYEKHSKRAAESTPVDVEALLSEEKELHRELRLIDDYFTKFNRLARRNRLDERIRSNLPEVKKRIQEMGDRGAELLSRQAEIYIQIFEEQMRQEGEL